MPSLLLNSLGVAEETKHPLAVRARVGHLVFYLLPQLRQPSCASGKVLRSGFLPPFWLIRRTPIVAQANCALVEVELHLVHNAVMGQAPLQLEAHTGFAHSSVHLPLLTNKVALSEGAELVLHAEAGPRAAKPQNREKTWRDNGKGRSA